LVDPFLDLLDAVGVVHGENVARSNVDGGGWRWHLDGQRLEESLPELDRHHSRDPRRSGGRVAAAPEPLCDPSDVEAGQA
jgi:hypothetical protein